MQNTEKQKSTSHIIIFGRSRGEEEKHKKLVFLNPLCLRHLPLPQLSLEKEMERMVPFLTPRERQ